MRRLIVNLAVLCALWGCLEADNPGVDAGQLSVDVGMVDAVVDGGPEPGCASHQACGAGLRCVRGDCVDRPQADDGFVFERVHVPGLHDHWSSMPRTFGAGIEFSSVVGNLGFGGALFDMDGDHDLDVFVGTQGHGMPNISPACIYENRSQPTQINFEPVEAYC